ncbi:hypothetical protein [Mycobacterium colombiense]|uniref:hypothetical protein n=1 Tax=Mycobacterium colombiense TaxID=339268 RepID=UPI0009B67765
MPVTDDPPSHPGAGAHVGPPVGQWESGYPTPQASGSRTWPLVALGAMVLALVATVVAVVALVFATSRSPGSSSAPTSTAPTYSAAEVSAAHQKLCDAYKLAARAVQIETNGTNQAFAGIATVNGAVMLENAVNTNRGLAPNERAAALALAEAYSNVAATSSLAAGQDPAWQSALTDANAKDGAMKKVCGIG